MTDQYKADIYKFDIESKGSLVNLTITNVISWDWISLNITKDDLLGLAKFIDKLSETVNP